MTHPTLAARLARAAADRVRWWERLVPFLLILGATFGFLTVTDWHDANTFDRGAQTVTGAVTDCWHGKRSGCEVAFTTVEGAQESGTVGDLYEVGSPLEIEYAVVEPSLIREAGEDTRGNLEVGAVLAGATLVPAVVLLALMRRLGRESGGFGRRFVRSWSRN